MDTWNDFHSDPRRSYYLFLRRGHQCSARTAHARVRQIDAMVMGLQDESYDAAAISWLSSVTKLLGLMTAVRRSFLKRFSGRALMRRPALPPHAQKWLASRFSHIA